MMNTKTLVIAAAVIAATASLALAPTFTTTALADKGGVAHNSETDVCLHNGNGRQVDCPPSGNSAQETTFCKVHGKFVPEDPNDADDECP
jgi:hypothetical protein